MAIHAQAPPARHSELATLLREAGSAYDVAAALEVIAGLAACPETGTAGDDNCWISLIAPEPTPAVTAALRALKREAAATMPTIRDPHAVEARLSSLRAELERRGLDGFIIPRADQHQSEYVPLNAQRLLWLTGFTGSAGLAIVLRNKAAIFVDGRYTLQVSSQVPVAVFEPRHITDSPPHDWVAAELPKGAVLGFDPWLHTEAEVARLRVACDRAGGTLQPCTDNPLDAVWSDRPPPPLAPVVPHALEYAGRSASEKRADIAGRLREQGCHAAVLSAPDSIAWLLNIRGGDVPHTPLALSFAIVRDECSVELFIDRRKIGTDTLSHLGNGVAVRPPAEFDFALQDLGKASSKVLVDPTVTAQAIIESLARAGATLLRGQDPCALPKARKNTVEIRGARAAHRRDSVAICRFLAWLARTPAGNVTEMQAEATLLAYRAEIPLFRDVSFPTISGSGPNGAIVHYRSTPETNRLLQNGDLYLVDSGAQFLDGTTDITRTVAIGTPSAEQREAFTRVLKGQIALATACFPQGTSGSQLDVLARLHLWQAGMDFDHGTGHGIGSYLGVHEGPQRISKAPNTVALDPGMIVSNEPGYYRAGAWGIRTENLLLVTPCEALAAAERQMLSFETLTLAPIDRALIDTGLLIAAERDWIDAYHARVEKSVMSALDETDQAWLAIATAPLP